MPAPTDDNYGLRVSSPETGSASPSIVLSPTFSNRLLHDLTTPSTTFYRTRSSNRDSIGSDLQPSRASSIVSTRTKTSIKTIEDDDQDGFDVQIGSSAVYRLGLDGCIKYITHTDPVEADQTDLTTPIARSGQPSLTLNAGLITDKQPTNDQQHTSTSPDITAGDHASSITRNPSFTPGKESLNVQRRSEDNQHGSVSPPESQASPPIESTKLRRRGGMKLKLMTRTSSGQTVTGVSPVTPNSAISDHTISPPSGRTPGTESRDGPPGSPTFIGRSATGMFPAAQGRSDAITNSQSATGDDTPTRGRRAAHGREEHLNVHGEVDRRDVDRLDDWRQVEQALPSRLSLVTPAGNRPPSPARWKSGFEREYGGLARILEDSHQTELKAKDKEITENREMMSQLARQVLDLKSELLRTKNQTKAMEEPTHNRGALRELSDEAQSFHLPPLRLAHVQVLKTAIKRRADKIRRNIDDELGRTQRGDVPLAMTPSERTAPSSLNTTVAESVERESFAMTDRDTNKSERDYTSLLRVLEISRMEDRAAKSEIENLQAHVHRLRESVSFWTDRCEALERDRQRALDAIEKQHAAAMAHVSNQLKDSWQQGWQARSKQLAERMLQVERDAQATVESAIAERDKRSEERRRMIVGLTAQLEMQEEEITKLKQWLEVQGGREVGHRIEPKVVTSA